MSECPNYYWERGLIGGSQKTQYELLRRILGTKSRITVLSALASTLSGRLNLPNFMLNIYGSTGSGKTLSVKYALSLLGSESLGLNWNATARGLVEYAYAMQDMPYFLDDLGIVQDSWSIVADFINHYTGSDARRNGLRGFLITATEWDVRTIDRRFSRHRHITAGAYSKIFEIDIDGFAPDRTFFRTAGGENINVYEISQTLSNHHGHFLLDWMRHLGTNANRIHNHYSSMTTGIVRTTSISNVEKIVASLRLVATCLHDMGFMTADDLSAADSDIERLFPLKKGCLLSVR